MRNAEWLLKASCCLHNDKEQIIFPHNLSNACDTRIVEAKATRAQIPPFLGRKNRGQEPFFPFFSPSIVDTAMAYLMTRLSNSSISPLQIGDMLLVVFFACWVACALPQSLSLCAKPEGLQKRSLQLRCAYGTIITEGKRQLKSLS
jgi:hypothetical protein